MAGELGGEAGQAAAVLDAGGLLERGEHGVVGVGQCGGGGAGRVVVGLLGCGWLWGVVVAVAEQVGAGLIDGSGTRSGGGRGGRSWRAVSCGVEDFGQAWEDAPQVIGDAWQDPHQGRQVRLKVCAFMWRTKARSRRVSVAVSCGSARPGPSTAGSGSPPRAVPRGGPA